jgi:tRNA G10  N-methylase Trm11
MPDDVWNQYSRVCGTFKERAQWHPCQMPESLLRRIIMASSNLKDCVLDPFCGSGTTAAAAIQLDRNYIGIDMSKQYVENCRKRLEDLKKLTANQKQKIMLTQLLIDMKLSSAEIISDKKLLTLFANQFSIRTNNDQQCDITMIEKSLKDLAN